MVKNKKAEIAEYCRRERLNGAKKQRTNSIEEILDDIEKNG